MKSICSNATKNKKETGFKVTWSFRGQVNHKNTRVQYKPKQTNSQR